jgi:C4-dicarboxylate-binding protein DctP
VRTQLATILEEVTVERNNAVGQVDSDARQAILDAGAKIVELDADQRQAWVDAMLPVWGQFTADVGQENIDAAQAINANH